MKNLTEVKGLPKIMQPLQGAAEIQTQFVDSKMLLLSLSGSLILKLSHRILCEGKRGKARLPLLWAEKIMNGILKPLAFEHHGLLGVCG